MTIRKTFLLLLAYSILTSVYAQNTNSVCNQAQAVELKSPASCPTDFPSTVTDTFALSNEGVVSEEVFPSIPSCDGSQALPASSAPLWFRFRPTGNSLHIQLSGGLQYPNLVLFESNSGSCDDMYAIACASDSSRTALSATVDPERVYYLLASGGGPDDQGKFELVVSSTNQCNTCVRHRQGHFTASPGPVNGTYQGGERVQMCYVVSLWNASATSERLHALELDFGPGWDESTLEISLPSSCSSEGSWGFFDSWQGQASGQQFGPGFAFDGPIMDGNPGNNRGIGGEDCANIGISGPEVEFCWAITTDDCPDGEYGFGPEALSVDVRLLGDGASGYWNHTPCFGGNKASFRAALYCPDPLAPTIKVSDANCGDACNGTIYLTGGGEGPWNYNLSDTSGTLVYSSISSTGTDTITGLCAGPYYANIFSLSASATRNQLVSVGQEAAPQASARFELPCYLGEPIYLYGSVIPETPDAQYRWAGPNGFNSTSKNPLALYPGTYTLTVSVDSCASEPFLLEIPEVEEAVVSIEQDTIIACPEEELTLSAGGNATSYTWYNALTGEEAGSGSTLTIIPDTDVSYRVDGRNDNGCWGVDEVAIRLTFQPTISADTSGVLCPGTPVGISAGGGDAYLWSTGDTTASINVSPEISTNYFVRITDANGCTETLSAGVSVASTANLFISPDASVCAGESVSLFAGGGDIQWSTGEQTSSITVMPADTTTYTATITDQHGCEYERQTTVYVSSKPDIRLVPEDTASICRGESILLQAFLSDTILYWESTISPLESTTYALPGADEFGCQEIGRFNIQVNPLPQLSIEGPSTLCGGESSALLIASTDSDSLLWNTGATEDSLFVSPEGNTTYSVTAVSQAGCESSDSITVVTSAAPEAPEVSCSAALGEVVFTWPADPGLTYELRPILGPAGIPSGNDTYTVSGLSPNDTITVELIATNADGCSASTIASCVAPDCSGLELFIAAPDEICTDFGQVALYALVTGVNSNGSGGWSGPGVIDSLDVFDPALAGSGTYELVYSYSEAGCSLSDTLSITVEQALEASMVECTASPGAVSFSWPALPQDTAYQVEVLTGQSGAFSGLNSFTVDSLQIGEEVVITITALGGGICGEVTATASCESSLCPPLAIMQNDTFLCTGASLELRASTEGWDSFEWMADTTLSCLDCANPLATPLQTTTYTLIAGNTAGCQDTTSYKAYVNEIPPSLIPDEPLAFCVGQPFELCLPEALIPVWVGPDAFLSTEQCLRFDNPTEAQAGPYYAFLRTEGCRFTKRFSLQAAPKVAIDSITDFQGVCPNDTFTVAVVAEDIVGYQWSPAEYLDCPDCPSTQGSVPQTATFTVQLTNSYGCTARANATVFVDDCQPQPRVTPPTAGTEMLKPSLFPNPARDNVQIVLPMEGAKTIQLWSASGELIRESRTSDLETSFTVSRVPGGTYLVRIITDKEAYTEWLVVSH